MNIRQLEIFITLMGSRSVTQAATLLNVSQPAVSKALKIIETELGLTLFHRHRGQLQATPEAQLLFPKAQKLLQEFMSVRRFAGDLQYEATGKITISASSAVAATFLAGAVKDFYAKRPEAKIEIKANVTRNVISQVAGNEVDIGFASVPGKDIDSRSIALCNTIDLCENEFVIVVPSGHPLQELSTVHPIDLRPHTMIGFPDETQVGSLVVDAFNKIGEPYKADIMVNQTSSVCYLVQSGVGIAMINPLALNAGEFPDLVVRPFRPRLMARSCIYTSRFRPLSQLAKEFIHSLHISSKEAAAKSKYPMNVLLSPHDFPE